MDEYMGDSVYLSRPSLVFVNGETGWHDGTLTVERRMIEIVTGGTSKPDPAWVAKDHAGHFHGTSNWDPKTPFPTLRTVQVPCGVPGHDSDCMEPEWRCVLCGAKVEPAFVEDKPYGFTEYVPGQLSWHAELRTVQSVTLARGTRVSVEMLFENPPHRYFGMAMVSGKAYEDGTLVLTLSGVGPLGKQDLA